MDNRKLLMMLEQLSSAVNQWQKTTLKNGRYNLIQVARSVSVNILLTAGPKSDKILMGAHKICHQLNLSCPGGKQGYCHQNNYWQKNEKTENIKVVLERFENYPLLEFSFNNQTEMEDIFVNILSHFEIIIPFGNETECKIIASPSLCRNLRRRFRGKVSTTPHHYWIWSAKVSKYQVVDYICKRRKFTYDPVGNSFTNPILQNIFQDLHQEFSKQPFSKQMAFR